MKGNIHPDYYRWIPNIECIDVAKHFDYCLGASIKYIWRAGRKNSDTKIEDLRKAIMYLNYEIEKEKCKTTNLKLENLNK